MEEQDVETGNKNEKEIDGKNEKEREFIKMGKFSFELEDKREQQLILQSGHMLTSFSIVSVMLLAIIPILLDYTIISNRNVFFLLGIALLFLVISLLGTIIAHWRYKCSSIDHIKSIYMLMGNAQLTDFNQWWLENLNKICTEKKTRNDAKATFMKVSTISFGISILSILIYLIIFLINYDLYS